MLAETGETIGTVADAATFETLPHMSRVLPGSYTSLTASTDTTLADTDRVAIRAYYNSLQKGHFHLDLERNPQPHSTFISRRVQRLNSALLDGRRISSTSCTLRSSKGSSIVKIIQSGFDPVVFASIDWMDYADVSPVKTDIWKDFEELEIETWVYNKYLSIPEAQRRGFPSAVPLHDVVCQLARGTVRTTAPEYWITTTMSRHIVLFDAEVEQGPE
ncbi:hypothetical protein C8J56DRAFT_1046695 [Mycena floridula]|nr:hypothetical protein C8J56DRAFT_1046695 [Mycena floridula]